MHTVACHTALQTKLIEGVGSVITYITVIKSVPYLLFKFNSLSVHSWMHNINNEHVVLLLMGVSVPFS